MNTRSTQTHTLLLLGIPLQLGNSCVLEGRLGSSADNIQLLPSVLALNSFPVGWTWVFKLSTTKEPCNAKRLVTYSPALTPSCRAWKPLWNVTYTVCMVMTSSPSVCLSAQRKIIMRINLTISCIPKGFLPALLNKELHCTLIPLEKGNNHSCKYD